MVSSGFETGEGIKRKKEPRPSKGTRIAGELPLMWRE
jgi:hypothetical protein